jgi:hypothetical protein
MMETYLKWLFLEKNVRQVKYVMDIKFSNKMPAMKTESKWVRIIYIVGIIALIIGIADPLEGSVVIASGSILITISTSLSRDRHRKIFLISMLLILTGVFFLFYLSSRGGFGGSSELSWWWGLLIAPYPAGWLVAIVTLIIRTFKREKNLSDQSSGF